MDQPAHHRQPEGGRYEIRVAGHLHPRWATRLDGMTLTQLDDGTTVLAGEVADQASLHGLLRTLSDLGLALVSLNRRGEAAPKSTHPHSPERRLP